MRHCRRFAAALLIALGIPPAALQAAAPVKVAVFDIELYDTSLEGELRGKDPAETERLKHLSTLLRQAVDERGDLTTIDVAPLHDRLEKMPALYSCGGCEAKLAGELGAQRSVSGVISKVSTLILYITVSVRDTASGQLLGERSVSIRGNTDISWQHGLNYLLNTQILTSATQ
jgi:hypothetical protein